MPYKKILILKNDRGGDLFSSLKTISTLRNEYKDITIFLSEFNYGFKFLFNKFKTKKINYNLSIFNKIYIIIFLLRSNFHEIYILSPKNFYFYLPLVFRKIDFYAVTVMGNKRNRPPLYLRKFLKKYVEISNSKIKSELPTRKLQLKLINNNIKIDHNYNNLSIPTINGEQKSVIPNKFIYFQFKKIFFEDFGWGLNEFLKIINLLLLNHENVLFSSDVEENDYNKYFYNNFSIIDLDNNKITKRNNKKIYFLNKINSKNLFLIINAANISVTTHGLITHMRYFFNKKSINLFNYQISNFNYPSAKISFSIWYANMKINFLFLKKDINKSLIKINKYL
jgi:hypothetical protein